MLALALVAIEPPITVGEARPVPVLKGVLTMPDGSLLGANAEVNSADENSADENSANENRGDENKRSKESGKALVVRRSTDGGKTWGDLAVAARGRQDLGDGNLVALKSGELALSYRDNAPPAYAIRAVRSADGGKSWSAPETVATNDRGLWAPFLLPLESGGLLCFYDDEGWPARGGRPGHQWIAARRYDPRTKAWGEPVVASRRPGTGLARDGMFVAVETSPGRIVGAVEDVAERESRPSGIYRALSTDGGRTWGWERGDRPAIFTGTWPHMAVSPAMADLGGGRILCAFGTDEGQATASRSGTPAHRMALETWGSLSRDGGRTWGPGFPLHKGTARDYLPALTPRRGGAWLNVLDFDRGPLLVPLAISR